MKSLLLAAAIFCTCAVAAQNDLYKDYLEKHKKPLVIPMTRNNNDTLLKTLKMNDAPAAFPDAKLEAVLSNGSKVFALPQDNMPCVVPDMKQFSIPNSATNKARVYNYNGPGAIPNPARPKQKARTNQQGVIISPCQKITSITK